MLSQRHANRAQDSLCGKEGWVKCARDQTCTNLHKRHSLSALCAACDVPVLNAPECTVHVRAVHMHAHSRLHNMELHVQRCSFVQVAVTEFKTTKIKSE